MCEINDKDIIYILKDIYYGGGNMLSIFTDLNEAKWYCQLYVKLICSEDDTLEWRENDDGVLLSNSKYQRYAIFKVERYKFAKKFNYYINVKDTDDDD